MAVGVIESPIIAAAVGGGVPTFAPNLAAGPGGTAISTVLSYVGGIGLVVSVLAMLISAMVWALGSHSGNFQAEAMGKKGVVISMVAAFVIGAAPALLGFALSSGTQF